MWRQYSTAELWKLLFIYYRTERHWLSLRSHVCRVSPVIFAGMRSFSNTACSYCIFRRNEEGRFWEYFKFGILNYIFNFHSHFSCSVIWGRLDLSSLSTASYSLSPWNRWYQSIGLPRPDVSPLTARENARNVLKLLVPQKWLCIFFYYYYSGITE